MKAVFTCGGTGGHINPALAVARVLLERRPDSEILFVGAEDGMEATLVPREGFRLETLQISSYMRSLKPSAIRHNVRAALSIRRALKKADRIIRDFQPDGHEAGADLLLTDQMNVCCLDHGIGCFDSTDQAAGLDHA